MSEYTKGPWFIVGDSILASGQNILDKFVAKQVCGENATEIKANSDLLSAAPELFDALKALVAFEADGAGNGKRAMAKARDAIAKAEGHA
jgi:hypothetical protein